MLALNASAIQTAAPDSLKTYRDSKHVAATTVLEQPVLCFSPPALSAQAKLFIDGFPGEVSYAVKANPCEQVISRLTGDGMRVFDVASIIEMETITRLCSNAVTHYHNPVKSRAEIATAWHTFGCRRFAADSIEELAKIEQVVGLASGAEIAIRFRLPSQKSAAHDFSSKFGVDEKAADDLIRHAVRSGFVPILTFHPGSQCTDPAAWSRHIEAAARISKSAGIRLTRLNVGGGFPARYCASRGPALTAYFETIRSSVSSVFGRTAPVLECEPGRSIVAPAFSLLTTVKLVRDTSSDLFLNDGIYGGLLEVAQASDLLPFYRVLRDGEVVVARQRREFTVFGPTCDPLDVLPLPLRLPADIRESDVIEFGGIGAYCMVTSTHFNGYGSAHQVTVDDAYTG